MGLFDDAVEEVTLKITGMHCQKCVNRVTAALEAVEGVTGVSVDLETETGVVTGSADVDALVAAVVACDFGCEVA